MTKAELVAAVAADTGLTKADAEKALAAVIANITKALKKGDPVSLVGFGTFDVSRRKARKGRNPQTGETIRIPAAKVPRFRAGKGLKEAVQRKRK
ncbi:MAG TPA: HU family DNA-binding protein [Deltaproteobacteria bacterium]|nr:HU family DNA-binding protein [Deltaproteobacteria bacterium]